MKARWTLAVCAALLSLTAGVSRADEQSVRSAVSSRLGNAKILEVRSGTVPMNDLVKLMDAATPRGVRRSR